MPSRSDIHPLLHEVQTRRTVTSVLPLLYW